VRIASRRARIALSGLATIAVLFVQAAPALAAAGCPRTTELAMESRVMCQVCGVPLNVASSLEADRERVFIQNLVNRCETVKQIETTLVAQYGPDILSTPSTGGFSLSAYLVPVIGVLGAALAISFVIMSARSRRRRLDDDPRDTVAPITGPEEARLDAALSAYRRQA
jgi:cytochrome c-type biogenesis protein CcmH/NrfF